MADYEVRIVDLRTATALDRAYVEANNLITEAEGLRRQWKAESFRKAMTKFREARRDWQMMANAAEEAFATRSLAEIYHIFSEYKKALPLWEQAVALYKQAGQRSGETDALNGIAYAYLVIGKNEESIAKSTLALEMSKGLGYLHGEAQALHNLGEAHYFDNPPKALEYFSQAFALWEKAAEPRGQAETWTQTGHVYVALGELGKALGCFQRGLLLWQETGDRLGQGRALTACGWIYCHLGDKQKALDLHNQALHLLREIGNLGGEAVTLNDIAYLYEDLGETQKALDHYRTALALYRQVNDLEGQAFTVYYVGSILAALGQQDKALSCYQESLAISRPLGDRQIQGFALRAIGSVYNAQSDKDKALAYYQQALSAGQAIGNKGIQAQVLNDIGNIHEALGRKEEAHENYQQSRLLSSAIDRRVEITALHNMARVEFAMGNTVQALDHIRDVFNQLESLRTKIISHNMRATFLATVRKSYELYINMLMQLHKLQPNEGTDAIALHISETARARSLLEMLGESRADIRQGVDPVLLERERSLKQLLSDKAELQTRWLEEGRTSLPAVALEKELAALTDEYEEIETRIRATSPHYAALTQPQPIGLKQIQQLLDPETLLLEYTMGEDCSYLWVVTADSMTSFDLASKPDIEQAARQAYALLTAPNTHYKGETAQQRETRLDRAEAEYPRAAAALSRLLLGPAAAMLGTKRLLIVADGLLQYIPFAALPAPNQASYRPLILDHEIINLPSASTLAVVRRETEGRKPAPKAVAVIADPVFSKNDPRVRRAQKQPPLSAKRQRARAALERSVRQVNGVSIGRLPFSRREAAAILSFAQPGESMAALDFQANKSLVTSVDLSRYRIVHIATHGLLDNVHPDLSAILLSLVNDKGEPQNGSLQLHEVYNLNLPVDLVVLSACQTALGREINGEGLIGLTRGFMYAGAARVVASLWKVDDAATAELMTRFYKKMLSDGIRPPAALRNAQIEMWQEKRWQSPYYWAAFVLQGEWK